MTGNWVHTSLSAAACGDWSWAQCVAARFTADGTSWTSELGRCLLPAGYLPVAQGSRGSSDEFVYAQDAAAAAAGGLMESSYRNLQEARVVLQAVHALMIAGRCGVAHSAVDIYWTGLARPLDPLQGCGS